MLRAAQRNRGEFYDQEEYKERAILVRYVWLNLVADSGYYSNHNVAAMEARHIDAWVPDSNLARELNLGQRDPAQDSRCRDPRLVRMREKMRSPEGRQIYRRRRAIVEPVFGTLKEQRNLRGFRLPGLGKVAIEFTLAATAYNLTRLHQAR